MGTRLEIPVGESATSAVVIVAGALPTDPATANHIGVFIGDAMLNDVSCSHLVVVALEKGAIAMKNSLTNEGGQAIEDRYTVRNPLDPTFQTAQSPAGATEANIWLGYEGTLADSSKSQFITGALEKLIAVYRVDVGPKV